MKYKYEYKYSYKYNYCTRAVHSVLSMAVQYTGNYVYLYPSSVLTLSKAPRGPSTL